MQKSSTKHQQIRAKTIFLKRQYIMKKGNLCMKCKPGPIFKN